jgi:hypothetical protein
MSDYKRRKKEEIDEQLIQERARQLPNPRANPELNITSLVEQSLTTLQPPSNGAIIQTVGATTN